MNVFRLVVVAFFCSGGSGWADCPSCAALCETVHSIVAKAQAYYVALETSTDESSVAALIVNNTRLTKALDDVEQNWGRAAASHLTDQYPCKVASNRFAIEGRTFLDAVQTLSECFPQAEPLPNETSLEGLLEQLEPPSEFENRLLLKQDHMPDSFLVSLLNLFGALAHRCASFANFSSQAEQTPSKALCLSRSPETLRSLSRIFDGLSHQFQALIPELTRIVERRSVEAIQSDCVTFEEIFRERTMPALRCKGDYPAGKISEDTAQTVFVETEESRFSRVTEAGVWNPQTMSYQSIADWTPVRLHPQTGRVCAPSLFRGMSAPQIVGVRALSLQREIDGHIHSAQEALHEIAETFSGDLRHFMNSP